MTVAQGHASDPFIVDSVEEDLRLLPWRIDAGFHLQELSDAPVPVGGLGVKYLEVGDAHVHTPGLWYQDFSGPSLDIDPACSGGLAAVQATCSALWTGEADTVLAGGLSVITNPEIIQCWGKALFVQDRSVQGLGQERRWLLPG